MQIGVVFPQTEIGPAAGAVRTYGQRVEELGFRHVLAYDHVVGADPAVHHGWNGPYDVHTTFHEPMVMFGYLAALTSLELVTGIIILPQRQTALVAKQAAEVDLLAQGRFRLEGMFPGTKYVFVRKEGYRFTGVKTADVNNLLGALDRAIPGLGKVVKQNANAAAAAGINALGKEATLEGRKARSFPLRFVDGAAFLGPLKVAQIPPLF